MKSFKFKIFLTPHFITSPLKNLNHCEDQILIGISLET